MLKDSVHRKIHPKYFYLGAIVLSLLVGGYLGYQNSTQSQKIEMLLAERNYFLLETASTTKSREEEREIASSTIAELSSRLSLTSEELDDIEDDYRKEKN